MTPESVVKALSDNDLVSAVEDVFQLHKTSVLPDGVARKIIAKVASITNVTIAYSLYEKMILEEAAKRFISIKKQ